MAKIDHLSPSQIDLFEMCGLAYKYLYIDKLPKPPPSTPVVKGSLIHYLIEKKIIDRNSDSRENIKRFTETPGSVFLTLSKDDQESVIKSANNAIEVIDSLTWYPEEPIELYEQLITYRIGDIKIEVKPDLITESSVYDHKVIGASSLFKYEKITYPAQLVIGAMAVGKPKAAYNLFIEDNKGNFIFKRIKFDFITLRFKRIENKIRRVWAMIENDMFYPVDKDGSNKWKCTRKFCDFFDMCEFGVHDQLPSEENIALF